ncbi:hypothetical protein N9C71_02690 [Candidatus Pelagibacter sp.]|nr:hypothetical protein [Candidatus Pelagibacter sp.]
MKKLLGIVVLCLLLNGKAYSDNLPSKIFGITLNDNAINYVDLEKGTALDSRPGVIIYKESNEVKIKGLVKNDGLPNYYIETDTQNKIRNIFGYKSFGFVPLEEFNNKCIEQKSSYIKTLSNYYEFNYRKFKQNYYKFLSQKKSVWLYDSSEFSFKKNSSKMVLQIMCSYARQKDEIISALYISLMDWDYYKELTNNTWSKIKKFDDDIIKQNLGGF